MTIQIMLPDQEDTMQSGLLPDWQPAPGETDLWHACESSRTAVRQAPSRPVSPSYIQRRHVMDASNSSAGKKHRSSFAVLTFEIDAEYHRDLLEQVFTEHLRRHGAYHTWVWETPEGYRGRTIDPENIRLQRDSDAPRRPDLRSTVAEELPDIAAWDMFLVAATHLDRAGPESKDPRFTVVFAVDHLYSDGMSLGIILYEITTAYRALLEGRSPRLPPVESYELYCHEEAEHTGRLHLGSADVQRWLDFVDNADGALPAFPLPLGLDPGGSATAASLTLETIASEEQCARFNQVCRTVGGTTNAGVLALAGLLHQAAGGGDLFSMLTPVSTRQRRAQIFSVGWYTRLVPVQFALPPEPSAEPSQHHWGLFHRTLVAAQEAVEASKGLRNTPLHRVAELAGPACGVRADFTAAMISYLDTRSMPGKDLVSRHNMAVYGSVDDSREVYLWINRVRDGMDLTFFYPGTPVAEESVAIYAEAFRLLFLEVAQNGGLTAEAARDILAPLRAYRPHWTVRPHQSAPTDATQLPAALEPVASGTQQPPPGG